VRFREEDARAMGRDTTGVRGMDVSGKDNYLLAMDVATPGQDLLVVTENGYGKRTGIDEYRLTARGAKGVKTIAFTESKGLLAAALVVREHQDLVFISRDGMVQRTSVRGINRYGRASQGVRVMNLREADEVSAVALVVESDAPAAVVGDGGDGDLSLGANGAAPAIDGDDGVVIAPDPEDELTLQPPEIVDDEMPDHDIEE
jgi:DNA gyrase subunit A